MEPIPKIDYSDFVIGCNKPNATVDATVIMDLRFFYKLLDRVEPLVLDCAIITNQNVKMLLSLKIAI